MFFFLLPEDSLTGGFKRLVIFLHCFCMLKTLSRMKHFSHQISELFWGLWEFWDTMAFHFPVCFPRQWTNLNNGPQFLPSHPRVFQLPDLPFLSAGPVLAAYHHHFRRSLQADVQVWLKPCMLWSVKAGPSLPGRNTRYCIVEVQWK